MGSREVDSKGVGQLYSFIAGSRCSKMAVKYFSPSLSSAFSRLSHPRGATWQPQVAAPQTAFHWSGLGRPIFDPISMASNALLGPCAQLWRQG